MTTNRDTRQLQPRWPLVISDIYGPYTPVDDIRESMIQNFIFLLRTNPGEWPMNPDLGVGLDRYLFEMQNSPELLGFKTKLEKQVRKYLPDITINSAEFVADDENKDNNVSILNINFSIKYFQISISVLLVIDRLKNALQKVLTAHTPSELQSILSRNRLSRAINNINSFPFVQ